MQTITPPTTDETKNREPRASRKPLWRSATEVVVCTALAVVALEGLFTIAGVGGQEFMQIDHKLGTKHIPGKQVIWRMEGFSADNLNSLGYRDIEHTVAKPAGVKRVAIMGDSHSEGLQVPLQDTYARRLEESLNDSAHKTSDKTNYEVVNFACSGYSTAQEYVQFLEEVVPYKPDVTVILMHWGNTTANIVDPTKRRLAQPRPYFYLNSQGQLTEDDSVSDWYYKPGAENEPFAKTISFLQRHSRIYGVLCQTDLALNINERLYWRLRGAFQRVLTNLQGKDHKAEPPGPVYAPQDATKVTEEIVVALSKECAKKDSKLVIMLLPDPSGKASEKLSKELTELGAKNNFGLLDLSDAFKKHPNSKELFLRVHLSSQGHKFVSDTLQDFLQQNGYLSVDPKPAAAQPEQL
jgi:hypothetical protein